VTAHRGIGLRVVLGGVALAIVGPIALASVFAIVSSRNLQLARVNGQNAEMARAVSIAIDQEVGNTTTALRLVAGLELFDDDAVRGFEELARRVMPKQPAWNAMLLADAEGQTLANTIATRPGDPSLVNPEWPRLVLASGEPSVSNIIDHPGVPGHFVVVSVPVTGHGVRYVLGAQLQTQAFTSILLQLQQNAPSNGVVTLLDRTGRILARTRNEEKYVGGFPSKGFLEAAKRMPESTSGEDVMLEGTPVYTALAKSEITGWTVGVALPRSDVDPPIQRNLWIVVGVSIAVLGAAGGLTIWFARAFERSIKVASQTAMALARSEATVMPRSRIRELNLLATGLRAAADTLQSRLEERDEAERLKDEFLMTLSHELRTPLTAIAGWSHMLATGEMREGQQARAIASIQRNAASLTQLVEDLLDVSRSISGKLRVDVQPVDVPSIVHAAVDAVRPAADAKDIRIETNFDPTMTTVLGDANRLRQVVWNLLSNAVKFTPNGGWVRLQTDVLNANGNGDERPKDGLLEISVRDTGPGIDEKFMPFIFDRFRQGSAGPARPHGGLGLGLAIVRQLVELHGGTVHAENNSTSEPQATGATFCVRLPAKLGARDARSPAITTEPPAEESLPARLDGASVLVVDDDIEARELFVSILDAAGAEVRAAASAEEAMFLVQTWAPTVLLSDIAMPTEDGYSLVRRITTLRGRNPIAIAVTAHARPEDRQRALEAGFQWHMGKPVDPKELVAVIAAHLAAAPVDVR
jgi:signal transduction histidine kinase/ActR/RegA family two-component response regulator